MERRWSKTWLNWKRFHKWHWNDTDSPETVEVLTVKQTNTHKHNNTTEVAYVYTRECEIKHLFHYTMMNILPLNKQKKQHTHTHIHLLQCGNRCHWSQIQKLKHKNEPCYNIRTWNHSRREEGLVRVKPVGIESRCSCRRLFPGGYEEKNKDN